MGFGSPQHATNPRKKVQRADLSRTHEALLEEDVQGRESERDSGVFSCQKDIIDMPHVQRWPAAHASGIEQL